MSQPRYQVFVSSTFRDLREERQAVLDAILELAHFPAGMEMFPASDSTAWAIIERVIRESDFYLLIVGGKYGSTDVEGISYTEREYDYAVQKGKPVLAFIHADPDEIPSGKSEMTAKARTKLAKFRKKVEERHCKYWKTCDELKYQAVVSLTFAVSTTPAVGWVRADGVDNPELLKRLAALQERHDQLIQENVKLTQHVDDLELSSVDGLSAGDDEVRIEFKYPYESSDKTDSVLLTWNQMFFGLATELTVPCRETTVRQELAHLIYGCPTFNTPGIKTDYPHQDIHVTDDTFVKIKIQFLALALIESTTIAGTSGDRMKTWSYQEPAWKLTPKGIKHLVAKKAIRN
ncbi:MAG: DUF4062 domain-containing protein [Planctomycetota bacterium]